VADDRGPVRSVGDPDTKVDRELRGIVGMKKESIVAGASVAAGRARGAAKAGGRYGTSEGRLRFRKG